MGALVGSLADRQTQVLIEAENDVPYRFVVGLPNRVAAAGFTRVGLAVAAGAGER